MAPDFLPLPGRTCRTAAQPNRSKNARVKFSPFLSPNCSLTASAASRDTTLLPLMPILHYYPRIMSNAQTPWSIWWRIRSRRRCLPASKRKALSKQSPSQSTCLRPYPSIVTPMIACRRRRASLRGSWIDRRRRRRKRRRSSTRPHCPNYPKRKNFSGSTEEAKRPLA